MAITVKLVQAILMKHFSHFNTSGAAVTVDTPFETSLSNTQVAGTSPRAMFKAICRHDIVGNGGNDNVWASDWAKQTCASLSIELAK
jgi:hypothetical protein